MIKFWRYKKFFYSFVALNWLFYLFMDVPLFLIDPVRVIAIYSNPFIFILGLPVFFILVYAAIVTDGSCYVGPEGKTSFDEDDEDDEDDDKDDDDDDNHLHHDSAYDET